MPVSNSATVDNLFWNIKAKLEPAPGHASQRGARVDIPAPVSIDVLKAEEARLGLNLPPLLRKLYTEIGNGGYGPGHGLLCLRPLSPKVDWTVATLYHRFRNARTKKGERWLAGVVPFAEWGDMIFTCIDLSDPARKDDPPVVRYEPNMGDADTREHLRAHPKGKGAPYRGEGLIPERDTLSGWFEDWVNNVEMFDRPYTPSPERLLG